MEEPYNPSDDTSPDDLWADGATGTDPDLPDPSCNHPWRLLQFCESGTAGADLVCRRCGRTWDIADDPAEAVMTLWQTTRLALASLQQGLDATSATVGDVHSLTRCSWCNRWAPPTSGFVPLGGRDVCPEHVGQLLAEGCDDRELSRAAGWLTGYVDAAPFEPAGVWFLDRALVEHPPLASLITASGRLGARVLRLGEPWVELLGDTTLELRDAVGRLARLLDLPAPTSRPGRALLLGILVKATALHQEQTEGSLTAAEEALLDALLDVAPANNRDRATVTMDLYRFDMPDDGVISGDMADDLVEALLTRAAADIAARVRA